MTSVVLCRQSDALVRVGFDQDNTARCATVAAATFIQFNGVLIDHVEHDSRGHLHCYLHVLSQFGCIEYIVTVHVNPTTFE